MDKKRTVRTWTATFGLVVPAAMALGLSADTSFRFMGDRLDITNLVERSVLCGTAEASIVALCLYTWATGTKGAARLAYAAVLIQSVPAFEVSGSYGGMIRIALGPVLLAVLLHLLLGLELRISRQKTSGVLSAVMREAKERLIAYFGLGRRGEDSAAIARSRAADRAVSLADKVEAAKDGSRRYHRLRALLADAIDRARHGLDDADACAAETSVVDRVVRRKSVAALATIEASHNWTPSGPVFKSPGQKESKLPKSSVRPVSTPDGLSGMDTAPTANSVSTSDGLSGLDTALPVRRVSNGSMRSFALSILADSPDTADDDLRTAILDKFGQDSKPNTVWRSIKRAREDMEKTA